MSVSLVCLSYQVDKGRTVMNEACRVGRKSEMLNVITRNDEALKFISTETKKGLYFRLFSFGK